MGGADVGDPLIYTDAGDVRIRFWGGIQLES